MKSRAKSLVVALAVCLSPCILPAQTAASSPCTLETPDFARNAPNIFNDRQEQDLGDAQAEYFEADMRIAPPAADDELTRIGEKLLATLPPTGIHYTFRIYDSGEVNAFSVAGGRVYVSRKMIAAVKSEDELAGVVAHEIGHISTHQMAIEMTYLFRVRMGVTSVGDRADVFAKYHQFQSTPAKDIEAEENETKKEVVADHVALYALVRAGYAAESFPAFFNQISMNQGKTGNWLSDVFGLTHQDSRRYREATKLIGELPAGCAGRKTTASAEFLAWQHGIVEERVKNAAESATGDEPIKLDPPLRPSLWRVRFSLDGKYVLTQDDGSIAVFSTDAQKVLFRIDAPDVNAAWFTPDSSSVVFNDSNLRVERWSVATGQRTDVKEVVDYQGCTQSLLTPDGKTLVCVNAAVEESSPRVGVKLIDVDTGNAYFEKPKFLDMNSFSNYYQLLRVVYEALSGNDVASIHVDPGSHFLLVTAEGHELAFDLAQRQPITLGGKLRDVGDMRATFMGSDRMYVVENSLSKGLYKAHIVSFPDGKVLSESQIGDQGIRGATKGPLMIVGPLKEYAVGVFDPSQSKVLFALKLPTIDIWDKKVAAEDAAGGLFLGQLDSTRTMDIPLPLGPLPWARAGAFSRDGKYLIVSLRNRSAVWDVETGKQVRVMRPMRSLWMDDQDHVFGLLPKYRDMDATEMEITLPSITTNDLGKYDDKESQYGNLTYSFKPMGNSGTANYHATLQVKKMGAQTLLWTRDYPDATPACWPADGDRMVLAWDLSNFAAKDEVKKYPKLQEESKALTSHKKGLLIETVTPETGAPLEQVALPEVDLSRGWNDERFAQLSGEYALVHGEHSNTVIYRLDTGEKVGEFFGTPLATDSGAGLIAAVNREDEILLVDERTGKEIERFTLGSPARLARIVTGKEKKLLVLTADQVVHQLPLPQ
ncbi:MAG: M48 family metalloprotease [Terracidiphilus sp.]